MGKPTKKKTGNAFLSMFEYIHNRITSLNQSKIFAGIIIIVLNVSGKFANIKLSKTMESYLKFTFSRDILIFSMAWMGTRDIYVAIFMTLLFSICMNYLFNEESRFCCLPESFTGRYTERLDNEPITPEQINDAKKLLEKAGVLADGVVKDPESDEKTPDPSPANNDVKMIT
jgi:hypothetical protein